MRINFLSNGLERSVNGALRWSNTVFARALANAIFSARARIAKKKRTNKHGFSTANKVF